MTEQDSAIARCIGVLTPDPLRLDGLRLLLEAQGRYRVVPLAEAEQTCLRPLSVALLDVASAVNLESLVKQLHRGKPTLSILVLGPEMDIEEIMRVVRFGARGYLPYSASEKELNMAIEVVLDGSIWAPRKVLVRMLTQKTGEPAARIEVTRREEEVLQLLVEGRPNRQIAEALKLDEATVKAHLGRLMRKLGVRNRIALSMHALARKSRSDVDEVVTD